MRAFVDEFVIPVTCCVVAVAIADNYQWDRGMCVIAGYWATGPMTTLIKSLLKCFVKSYR